jgi:A/G-specific adenine glycosylase
MTLQQKLLDWYMQNHRKLPFRESHDPYNIWISEIMLQQTQMDTVIPYYERFMARFPSVIELANAREEEVFKVWRVLDITHGQEI